MPDVEGRIVLGLDIANTTQQISQDLNNVLNSIRKKEIILNAKIDNIDLGNTVSQIKNVTGRINQEFNSTLNVIDLVNGGIGNLKNMLQGAGFSNSSMSAITQDLQTMNLQISKISTTMSKNGNIQLRISGTDQLQRAVTVVRQYDAETGKVANTSKTFVQSFQETTKAASDFSNKFEQAQNAIASNKIETSIASVTTQFNQLGTTGHDKLSLIQADLQTLDNLQKSMTSTQDNTSLVNSYQQYEEVLSRVKNNLSIVKTETNATAQAQNTLAKSAALSSKMDAWMNQNAKAAQAYGDKIRELQSILSNNSTPSMLTSARLEFSKIQSEAKAAGLTTNQFGESIKNAGLQLLGLSSGVAVIQKIISTIREGVDVVVGLDTALVDLQKTTTMSGSQLATFYKDANTAAKELGVTTKDMIQSAADWSRMGYSDKNSSEMMARLSAQFAAISPGADIEQATSGLLSTMKAYGIEVEDVLDGIMSKINIIGNTAGTSNAEIITGLSRSAAAMSAMNSTLDENIALFTAAQEIIQNDSQVGNAIRSISLRIRGYDEETEQLSEELANISGEVVDLTKTVQHAEGVSLFTDASQEHYKTVYEYLQDISEIYDELSEKQQQQLMEKLFGKNRANVGQAILTNFAAAEQAMNNMAHSAGNADAEMEVITNSLEFKLNALAETSTGIFQEMFPREDIGMAVDALTGLLEIIGSITTALGPLGTAFVGIGIGTLVKNFD